MNQNIKSSNQDRISRRSNRLSCGSLPIEAVKEFQQQIRLSFGLTLSKSDATHLAKEFLEFYRSVTSVEEDD